MFTLNPPLTQFHIDYNILRTGDLRQSESNPFRPFQGDYVQLFEPWQFEPSRGEKCVIAAYKGLSKLEE